MGRVNFSAYGTPGRLAECVSRAVSEHGVPNSFSPGELAASYGGGRPADYGIHAHAIVFILRTAGYRLEYSSRRFVVTGEP